MQTAWNKLFLHMTKGQDLYVLSFFAYYDIFKSGDYMRKTIIYLIRHSEQLRLKGTNNSKDIDQIKNEKIVLSIEGEEKAAKLSMHPELNNIDMLYASNYARAISTAKYIASQNKLEINIDSRLGERKLRRFRVA